LINSYLRTHLVARPSSQPKVQPEMLAKVLTILAIVASAVAADDFDPFIDIPFKRLKTSVGY